MKRKTLRIPLKRTERGFALGEFLDRYGQRCSIQKSSAAAFDVIWLGVDINFRGEGVHCRMHLNRLQAARLLPLLRNFVRTGELAYPKRRRKREA